jgi:hypothetical protein
MDGREIDEFSRGILLVKAEFDAANHRSTLPSGTERPSAGGRLRSGDRNAKGGAQTT